MISESVRKFRAMRDASLREFAQTWPEEYEAKARELMRAFSFPAAFGRELNIKGYGRVWRLPLTFVIDRQGTASDVRRLAETVRAEVRDRLGVELALEVEFVGDWSAWTLEETA